MKVALCFWGLTRSLKHTINSIQEHVLQPLKQAEIEYTIFMHTYTMSTKYHNPRTGEVNMNLDFDEYKLLNPDYIQIDDQDDIKSKIQMNKYHSLPDPWESNYICLDNFVCAMYSKKQLGIMVKNSNETFDYIVYLRPDVRYLNNIDIRYFHNTHKNIICTPNFHLFPQLNDRLAILKPCNLKEYSEMFNEMYEYSRVFPLHSERFQYNIITRRFLWKIVYIPFHFNRVRINGHEERDMDKYYKELRKRNGKTPLMTYINNRIQPPITPPIQPTQQKIIQQPVRMPKSQPLFKLKHIKDEHV